MHPVTTFAPSTFTRAIFPSNGQFLQAGKGRGKRKRERESLFLYGDSREYATHVTSCKLRCHAAAWCYSRCCYVRSVCNASLECFFAWSNALYACTRLCMSRTIHTIASKRSCFRLKLPLFLHYWVSFEFAKYSAFTMLFSTQRKFFGQFQIYILF